MIPEVEINFTRSSASATAPREPSLDMADESLQVAPLKVKTAEDPSGSPPSESCEANPRRSAESSVSQPEVDHTSSASPSAEEDEVILTRPVHVYTGEYRKSKKRNQVADRNDMVLERPKRVYTGEYRLPAWTRCRRGALNARLARLASAVANLPAGR